MYGMLPYIIGSMPTLPHQVPTQEMVTNYFSTYNGRCAGLLREGATSISDEACIAYVAWTLHMMNTKEHRLQVDRNVANHLKRCTPEQRIELVRAYFEATREMLPLERRRREADNRKLRGFARGFTFLAPALVEFLDVKFAYAVISRITVGTVDAEVYLTPDTDPFVEGRDEWKSLSEADKATSIADYVYHLKCVARTPELRQHRRTLAERKQKEKL